MHARPAGNKINPRRPGCCANGYSVPTQYGHQCNIVTSVLDLPRQGSFRLRIGPIVAAHMNRTLKTLLLWLLIAALPIQGLAAAMQASCGPAHHTALAISAITDAHPHAGKVTYSHDGQDALTHHAASDSPVTAEHSSGTQQKHQSSFCSACAVCCVAAVAPPSAAIHTPVYSNSGPVVLSPSPLVTGFIPAGLERPPKRISA